MVIVVIASILLIALIVLWVAVSKKKNKAEKVPLEHPVTDTPVSPEKTEEKPEEIHIKGDLWEKIREEEQREAAREYEEEQEKPADGVVMLYEKPRGAVYKWQCTCCGAMNDDSEQTCVVCIHPRT